MVRLFAGRNALRFGFQVTGSITLMLASSELSTKDGPGTFGRCLGLCSCAANGFRAEKMSATGGDP